MRPVFRPGYTSHDLLFDKQDMHEPTVVGIARYYASIERKNNGGMFKSLDHDIEGAAAEFTFSFFSGLEWHKEVNRFQKPDVGIWEVRNRWSHKKLLRLYLKDIEDQPYVLVTGKMPLMRIVGWIWGWEAKQGKYWGQIEPEREPMFYIPHSDLTPFNWNDFRTGGTRACGNRPFSVEAGGIHARGTIQLSVQAARDADDQSSFAGPHDPSRPGNNLAGFHACV